MVLLAENEEDRVFVRDQLSLKESDIKRDVEILNVWLKKQPHLPQGIQSDSFFEHMLFKNKGRVEKAKQNIDIYYTIKTLWPDSYENLHDIRPGSLPVDMCVMPQLTDDKRVIYIVRYHKNSAEKFSMLESVKECFAILEILNKRVHCSGIEVIWDLTDMKLEMFKLITPNRLQQIFTGLTEVYSQRVFGIHCYNPPSWIGLLLNTMKYIVKAKIFDRITLQNNQDSLLKVLPKKYLPSDYGGDQATIKELTALWDQIIIENKQFLEEVPTLKSNETLRVGKCHIDTQMFGVDGTFKNLNLD